MAASVCSVALAQDPSAPAPSPLAGAFGNTIVSTYADGRHQLIWFQPDGSWSGVGRNGKPLSGHWKVNAEGKVCMKQTEPPTLPISYCANIPATAQVGGSWTSKDVIGRKITLSVVSGHLEQTDQASLTPTPAPATP